MTQKGTVKSTCKHCGLGIELRPSGCWDHGVGWTFCANATQDRFKYGKEQAEPFNFNDYLKQIDYEVV